MGNRSGPMFASKDYHLAMGGEATFRSAILHFSRRRRVLSHRRTALRSAPGCRRDRLVHEARLESLTPLLTIESNPLPRHGDDGGTTPPAPPRRSTKRERAQANASDQKTITPPSSSTPFFPSSFPRLLRNRRVLHPRGNFGLLVGPGQ